MSSCFVLVVLMFLVGVVLVCQSSNAVVGVVAFNEAAATVPTSSSTTPTPTIFLKSLFPSSQKAIQHPTLAHP